MASAGLYKISRIVGAGSQSIVCVARDLADPAGERHAIKVLRRRLIHDPAVLDRALDEAAILMRVEHPNVVRASRLLDYAGAPVVEMEFVDGVALEDVLHARPRGIPTGVALEICARVAEGLDAAHHTAHGSQSEPMRIVHRDVKPQNVLISRTGEVKITDFGIAKGDFTDRLARSVFMVPGSQGFQPPERRSREDGPPVDVYALGIMAVRLITGRTLVVSEKIERHDVDVIAQLAHVRPDDLNDPAPLTGLLASMLGHSASSRPPMPRLPVLLRELADAAGLCRDVAAFARQAVEPLARDRDQAKISDHPLADEVRFLEREAPTPPSPPLTGPAADAAIRAFLDEDGWERRPHDLRRLLARTTHPVVAPFLELLRRHEVPWWRVWQKRARPAELEAALLAVADHPTAGVIDLADTLTRHREPRVRAVAQYVLDDFAATEDLHDT